jgi:hypothetical protein
MWVEPPDEEALLRAHAILGKTAKVIMPAEGTFDFSSDEDLLEAIVGIITRHPMREIELIQSLEKWSPDDVKDTLQDLQNSEKAQVITRYGTRFWSASQAHYPNSKRKSK